MNATTPRLSLATTAVILLLMLPQVASATIAVRDEPASAGRSGSSNAGVSESETQEVIRLFLRQARCDTFWSADRYLAPEPGFNEPLCGAYADRLWSTPSGAVPMVFDASIPITGRVVLSSCGDGPPSPNVISPCSVGHSPVGLGAGAVQVQITVTGEADGRRDELGQWATEYLVTPLESRHALEFSMPADPGLDNMRYDRLFFDVDLEGTYQWYGRVWLNGASFVNVPVHTQ